MHASPTAVFARLSTARPSAGHLLRLEQAVVLGGSMAGLLAARVLAEHARTVVIVERDEAATPGHRGPRPGVPQGTQTHIFLRGELQQLQRWFPGFAEEAVAAGAVQSRVVTYLDNQPQAQDPHPMLAGTRDRHEALLRQRVLALPNVRQVSGAATALAYHDGAVHQVRYRSGDEELALEADFVVDAMGRSSRLSTWLDQDGWDRPVLERVPTNIKYATAFFERVGEDAEFALASVHNSRHFPAPAMGLLNAVEDRRWMIGLAAYDDNLDGSESDFRSRVKQLPPVFERMARGRLIGNIETFRQADSRRRRYTDLKQFPSNLVSVGDAVASYNPIFGQGLASSALHASALSEYLRLPSGRPSSGGPSPVLAPTSEFFARQQVVVDVAWEISTAADRARQRAAERTATGATAARRPLSVRFSRWVLGQVHRAAAVDEQIAARRNAVVYMTAHPRVLAAPGLVLRALYVNRQRRRPVPDLLSPAP